MGTLDWIGDGSDGILSITGEEEVSIKATKVGTPFSVCRRGPESIGTSCECSFQITIREMSANVSVGVVTPEEFRTGWKTKGMFYNGNVTNGSAGLIIQFGPHIKVGDTVGCQLMYNSETKVLETHFSVNGKGLGTAFRLEDINPDQVFQPCVQSSGSCKFVVVSEQSPLDDDTTPATDYEGDWKLQSLSAAGGENIVLPAGRDIILSFQGSPPAFFKIKVGNTIAGPLEIKGVGEGGSHTIEIGMLRSTKMMPPPELRELEKFLQEGLPTLTEMTILEGGHNLRMSSSGTGGLELTASRYTKTHPVLTKY